MCVLLYVVGYQGWVKSLIYMLVEFYEVFFVGCMVIVIYFDLYCMVSLEEFFDVGFCEYFNENLICIVEWFEKGDLVLLLLDIYVNLLFVGDGCDVELCVLFDKGY